MYNNFSTALPPSYESIPSNYYQQQPIYSNQYAQPSYVDNSYMNQPPPQPMYQGLPQQPSTYAVPAQSPPMYAPAAQPPPYTAPVIQQQPTNNNPNSFVKSSAPSGTPFSKGYKWPRKTIQIVCPQCGATVTTRVETSITVITIIGAIVLFLFTCILVCLPFCTPACKRATHYCPYCNSVIGIRKPLQ
ncbi:unnamed protein product [Adineta ricciae]|uniref:LITAF domain-containing protein n=1 Tax=Adineta ricciae TaxID=249248 RepID=A0A814XQZ4_ADIRI|nr:unnamed protein product [Adineta ricciae]CAF1295613.1 unnamed protein product [Adineta ricciae]